MSVDAAVNRRKYPDEEWTLAARWTNALLPGETIVGQPTAVGVGVEVETINHDGLITKVRVVGGNTANYDHSARVEFLAELSSGDKIGFNLGVPTQPR